MGGHKASETDKKTLNRKSFGLRVAGCRSKSGFTLIEVLVAMAIFAVAVLGLAMGAASVMRANQTSYFTTIATNLAQDKLEELKAMPAANITGGGPEIKTFVGAPAPFTRTWTVTAACNGVTGLSCITVTIAWTDYIPHTVTVTSAVKQ